jgi:hypothetical protein
MDQGIAAGARSRQLALLLSIGLTTLQRGQRQVAGDGGGVDCRKGSNLHVSHRLSKEERPPHPAHLQLAEIRCAATGQILSIHTDRGLFIGSERSFYRVLHCHGQDNRRGRARPPQEPRPVPCLRAAGPNQRWSWDITYLPTIVRGIWLYLYLVIGV